MRREGLAIMVLLVSLFACTQEPDNRTCVTEPGKAIYGGTEKCCGELVPIFGSQSEDGRCWCTDPYGDCVGAPTCAPCGNGICEAAYSENSCTCPKDCE